MTDDQKEKLDSMIPDQHIEIKSFQDEGIFVNAEFNPIGLAASITYAMQNSERETGDMLDFLNRLSAMLCVVERTLTDLINYPVTFRESPDGESSFEKNREEIKKLCTQEMKKIASGERVLRK